jgi:hypothetical protein
LLRELGMPRDFLVLPVLPPGRANFEKSMESDPFGQVQAPGHAVSDEGDRVAPGLIA